MLRGQVSKKTKKRTRKMEKALESLKVRFIRKMTRRGENAIYDCRNTRRKRNASNSSISRLFISSMIHKVRLIQSFLDFSIRDLSRVRRKVISQVGKMQRTLRSEANAFESH